MRKEMGLIEVRGDDKYHIRTLFPMSTICLDKIDSYNTVSQ